jgi:hypothetical protein
MNNNDDKAEALFHLALLLALGVVILIELTK